MSEPMSPAPGAAVRWAKAAWVLVPLNVYFLAASGGYHREFFLWPSEKVVMPAE